MKRATIASDAGPASLWNKRILVAEDEYLVADELASDLECYGAEVIGPVPTIEDALRGLDAAGGVDGAVLDINLCGEMVYPLAETLRERGIPFVFSTGYDQWSIPAAYRNVPLCEKPVDSAEIAKALFG